MSIATAISSPDCFEHSYYINVSDANNVRLCCYRIFYSSCLANKSWDYAELSKLRKHSTNILVTCFLVCFLEIILGYVLL